MFVAINLLDAFYYWRAIVDFCVHFPPNKIDQNGNLRRDAKIAIRWFYSDS